ncbi:MAG: class I SAM-dependent methyltransferase [Gaiellaceae bacterium]
MIAGAAFDEAMHAIRDVPGWLTEGQARMLYESAARLRPGATIVEIGSHLGRSTILLALAAPEGVSIVAIDPFGLEAGDGAAASTDSGQQNLERFRSNLERAGVEHRVQHVRDFSSRALDRVGGSVDLLYVDGSHSFRDARADVRQWGDRVCDGGTMLIHDSFSSIGVTLTQLADLFLGPRFRYCGRSRSLSEYRRERLSLPARLGNAARQLVQLPWFARNVVVKVAMVSRARPVGKLLGHTDEYFPY